MYVEPLIEIGKAENGYVIRVTVPHVSDEREDSCCPVGREERQILSLTVEDVLSKLEKLLPALTEATNSPEVQLKHAFDEALETVT